MKSRQYESQKRNLKIEAHMMWEEKKRWEEEEEEESGVSGNRHGRFEMNF